MDTHSFVRVAAKVGAALGRVARRLALLAVGACALTGCISVKYTVQATDHSQGIPHTHTATGLESGKTTRVCTEDEPRNAGRPRPLHSVTVEAKGNALFGIRKGGLTIKYTCARVQ